MDVTTTSQEVKEIAAVSKSVDTTTIARSVATPTEDTTTALTGLPTSTGICLICVHNIVYPNYILVVGIIHCMLLI